MHIDIVIPIHNEAKRIGATLASIEASVRYAQAMAQPNLSLDVPIHIGADSCTDASVAIASRFPNVCIKEFLHAPGKWATLKTLCLQSTSDWLILVDAGTLWPKDFLKQVVLTIMARRDVIGLAPAYRPVNAGWIHRSLWRVEKSLKQMETWCGGPVSVHGATVCYQTSALQEALRNLGESPWLNDDVAIPLTLRSMNPGGVILYPVGVVQDAGIEADRLDIGRRKRILAGNLQWVRALLPFCFRSNPVVGLLSLRRLFRMFWAYWFTLIVLSVALADQNIILPLIAIGTILLAVSASIRQLAGAALVSLLAPFRLARSVPFLEATWQ